MTPRRYTRPDGVTVTLRDALPAEGLGWVVTTTAPDGTLRYSNRQTVLARSEGVYERHCGVLR